MRTPRWFSILFVLFFALGAVGLIAQQYVIQQRQGMSFLGALGLAPTAISIADNGVGTAAPYTLTSPNKAAYVITCADTNGCAFFLGETGAFNGQILYLENGGSNTVTVNEASGKSHMQGTTFAEGTDDNIAFRYNGAQWNELWQSNNH